MVNEDRGECLEIDENSESGSIGYTHLQLKLVVDC